MIKDLQSVEGLDIKLYEPLSNNNYTTNKNSHSILCSALFITNRALPKTNTNKKTNKKTTI